MRDREIRGSHSSDYVPVEVNTEGIMGTLRTIGRSFGVGEASWRRERRAEDHADMLSEPLPAITKKSRRPGLVLGQCPTFQKRKRMTY